MKVDSSASKTTARRRGVILVLTALLLVALLSFVALAVDIGVIATARAQLQTVADAAALAGAKQLAIDRRISTLFTGFTTTELNVVTTKATQAGNANSVLNKAGTDSPAPDWKLTSSNLVVGYKNPRPANSTDAETAVDPTASQPTWNSVQVTASTTIPALFSAAFRSTGSTVSVTSTATVEVDLISGFKSNNNLDAGILPIVMGTSEYNNMISGTGGDSYTFTSGAYNPPSSNGVTGTLAQPVPDGIKESVAYPVPSGESGNWGTINFGVSNNSTSTLGSQIQNGITPTQLLNEFPSGTVTASVASPHRFSANPGISAGLESYLNTIIGKAVSVPIYSSSGSNGNNAWYDVAAFATVRVVAVDLHGQNKYVIVQPALNNDPTAIPNTTGPPNSWSNGGVIFLHLSR